MFNLRKNPGMSSNTGLFHLNVMSECPAHRDSVQYNTHLLVDVEDILLYICPVCHSQWSVDR